MTQPNSTVLVTPGTGETVGTHTVGSNKYQGFVKVDPEGHIYQSRGVYYFQIPSQTHVAAAATVHWDLFNADAALLVRVRSIRQVPDITVAVVGGNVNWKLSRSTAVGTGGSSRTGILRDLSQTALDADITCRSKPTGGATEGVILRNYQLNAEETSTGAIMAAARGGMELLRPNTIANGGIILRQNQGLRCTQLTNSAAGSTMWFIEFEVE